MDLVETPDFLRGGGEMGARIRAHDWARTALGEPRMWPQPLRTAIRLILNTRHPMYVFWGPDGVCFYNDAYSASIGPERHPGSLGMPAREVWEEIFPIIGPQIDQVMRGDGATWHANHLVPITRFGRFEEVYWTYSYGPIDDESAPTGVGGVLVVCTETTEMVRADARKSFALAAAARLEHVATPEQARDVMGAMIFEALGVGAVAFIDGRSRTDAAFARAWASLASLVAEGATDKARSVRDAQEAPSPVGEVLRLALGEEVRGAAWSPICDGSRLAEIFVVWDASPRAWSFRELDLVTEAARQTIEAARRTRVQGRLRAALEATSDGLWDWDIVRGDVYHSPRYVEMLGYTPETWEASYANWLAHVHPDDVAATEAMVEDCLSGAVPEYAPVFRMLHRDGGYRWVRSRAKVYRDAQGTPVRMVGTHTDVTAEREAAAELHRHREELERLVEARTAALLRAAEERRRAEEAMRQSEKLAALGQLTGGVAHDFNNLLQVVASGAALLKMTGLGPDRRERVLDKLVKAGETARSLTDRLLAFARMRQLAPETFTVAERLDALRPLLQQTVGSRIPVATAYDDPSSAIRCDPGELEIALINLAANARDAMPDGGRLTIRTRPVTLAASHERSAGEYVAISVSDVGTGMAPAIAARAMEPFFTTKGPGKGTGLGLAQVFGFVKQSLGDVRLDSEPGRGTTVELFLPRMASSFVPAEVEEDPLVATMQSSTGRVVLVVDDNTEAREFAAEMLESLGYQTARAASAAEALAHLGRGEPVDAVFSDVVMPGAADGIELALTLKSIHPRVAVVLASGYADSLGRVDAAGIEVLSKPYQLRDLARALRKALPAGLGGA